MNATDYRFQLLNNYQHTFPLVHRPFAQIAEQMGLQEDWVMTTLHEAVQHGEVSRIGPVFRPNRVGVSTLVALAVPPIRLESTADWISSLSAVNHNYLREHEYNLWFVAVAENRPQLDALLANIRQHTGCRMLDLPMQQSFHIDLGFDLASGRRQRDSQRIQAAPPPLNHSQRELIRALQPGLPLTATPYQTLTQQCPDWDEAAICQQIADWQADGTLSRFGVVVRHHEFGFKANAMVVWNVPEAELSAIGELLAGYEGVNLCYSRPRRLPDWPYNLFCMLHGRDRTAVEARLADMRQHPSLSNLDVAVLFSTRRYKQCGARYLSAA